MRSQNSNLKKIDVIQNKGNENRKNEPRNDYMKIYGVGLGNGPVPPQKLVKNNMKMKLEPISRSMKVEGNGVNLPKLAVGNQGKDKNQHGKLPRIGVA